MKWINELLNNPINCLECREGVQKITAISTDQKQIKTTCSKCGHETTVGKGPQINLAGLQRPVSGWDKLRKTIDKMEATGCDLVEQDVSALFTHEVIQITLLVDNRTVKPAKPERTVESLMELVRKGSDEFDMGACTQ